MNEDIITTKNEATARILEATSLSNLDEIEITYLGRNGRFTALIKQIKDVAESDRKDFGAMVNNAKQALVSLISEKRQELKSGSDSSWFDPTIPGVSPKMGHLHLITQAINEISSVFQQIGFVRVRYPEVEWDWYAFGALNFPENHPARDDWETFFIDTPINKKYGPALLTPHTSSGQIREMQRVKTPPIRMINIAKCYRRQSDISHNQMFHQFEGLVIDKDINVTNLKGTLDYFAENFFGHGRKSRLRPYHFQFTEPSFEVDISCDICNGKGCKLCKEGWLEIGGSGMVHPNVLRAGGIDPEKYSGFAFGWGVERALMMKSGLKIADIRQLCSTDIRYLQQF